MKQPYTEHRKRIKGKYRVLKFEGWQDYEIIEFVLGFAIARKDTKGIAKDLVSRIGSLTAVLNADLKELEEIKGIGSHSAALLRSYKDVSDAYTRQKIFGSEALSSPEKIVDYSVQALKALRMKKCMFFILTRAIIR